MSHRTARPSGSPARRRLRHMLDAAAPPLLLFVVVMVLWHAATILFHIQPYVLPGPLRVWAAATANAHELLSATALTAAGAGAGFLASLLVGSLVAFIFAQSRWIQRSFYPYAIFLQTVPIVAIAPLIIYWIGYGFPSIVAVSFMISLFPIITNGTTGLTTLDRNLLELFELGNATRLQLLLKLRLPNAIPYLVTGAKISSGLSVIGAIVGEFFAGLGVGSRGLGYLIAATAGNFKIDFLFAAIIASALLGLLIFITVNWIGQRILTRWQE